jgi:TPR repeat protein
MEAVGVPGREPQGTRAADERAKAQEGRELRVAPRREELAHRFFHSEFNPSLRPMGRKARAAGGGKKQDPEELYQSAVGHHQSGRKEEAAELLSQAAAQGHAGAQAILGSMYCYGEGVPQDTARGVALLEQAAAQGNVNAQNALAKLANIDEASASEMAEALIREEEEAEAFPLACDTPSQCLTLTLCIFVQAARASKGKKKKAKKKAKQAAADTSRGHEDAVVRSAAEHSKAEAKTETGSL